MQIQGSTITDLAAASGFDRERVKKILKGKIEPFMVTGGKRKIEYFDHEATIKIINDYKAEQEALKTPVAQAVSAAVADTGKVIDEVVKKVTAAFGPKFQSLGEELHDRDLSMSELLKKLVNASEVGQQEVNAQNAAIREYITTANAKLGQVEQTVNRTSKDHVEKLHALRTEVEKRLSSLADSTQQLLKETAKNHDDFKIRLELIEHEVSETNSTVKGIYAMLQSVGMTNPLIPLQASPPSSAAPAPAPAPAADILIGPKPILGLVGFLDRQNAEIMDRLKDKVEFRMITSQARNPSVSAMKKCEMVWVSAAFTQHTVQHKLTAAGVKFEIMPNGAMSGAIRVVEDYLEKRREAHALAMN